MPHSARSLVLEAVCERDVDLLLVEELLCSPSLQRLVFEAVADSSAGWAWASDVRVTVQHSVPHNGHASHGRVVPPSGETDIEIAYEFPSAPAGDESGSERFVVLIENKIEATFMPRQPERYLARAVSRVRDGACRDARALIVAPADYLSSVTGAATFHGQLSYERLAAHFVERAGATADLESARRYRHRAEVLEHAIKRYRRGYRAVTHPGVKAFRHAYHTHCERVAPGLRLQPQFDHHWEGDDWMEFRHALAAMPGIKSDIVHKCPQGRVDLQLYGWAKHEEALRPQLESLLEPGMYVPAVRRGTKGLMVMIPSPTVIPQKPFKPQVWAAEIGMRGAVRLQEWYHRHADALAALAASIEAGT